MRSLLFVYLFKRRWPAVVFVAASVLCAAVRQAAAQSRGITGRGGIAPAGGGAIAGGGFGLRGGIGFHGIGSHGRTGLGSLCRQVSGHSMGRFGCGVGRRQGVAGSCGNGGGFGLTRPFRRSFGSLGLTRPGQGFRATPCSRGPNGIDSWHGAVRHPIDHCPPRHGHLESRPCFIAPYFLGYGYSATVVYEEPYTSYADEYGEVEPPDPVAAESAGDVDAPAGLLHLGAVLLKRGDYEAAADVLFEAGLVEAEAVLPRMLFVHALFANGEYDYAAYVLQTALAPSEDAGVYKLGILDLYADEAEFHRLLVRLGEYAKRHSFEYDPHLLLGYFRYFAGKFQAAIRSLNEALRIRYEDSAAKVLRDWARGAAQAEKTPRVIQPKIVYPPGRGPGAERAEVSRE